MGQIKTLAVIFLCFQLLILFSCDNKTTLFEVVSSAHSGIHFDNRITENDSINPLDLVNIYNGGGVGIGDFNNDGLQDIYFTGNTISNKLYLNKGNLEFVDVTSVANVGGEQRWSRGVAMVDINNDGWLDMYVCCTILNDPLKRENLLYINQGIDERGIPHFKESAREYELNDTSHSTMAAFFDYDNDLDLDMYLVVNVIPKDENPNIFRTAFKNGEYPSTGRLYRNDKNDSLKHPRFVNISKEAGITIEGYGHSASITDLNKDGWKDIYVANDFMPDNILYINNHDGTFTNKARDYFKHTSANSMGQDIIDINNDGLQDVIELDMNPEDNFRKKTMMTGNNYRIYQNFEAYGYQYQYVRNVLQLNQGPRVKQHDSIGDPVFSDIGFYAGIAETDWSWAPVVTDFDNDGYRDIIISNGYPKDITDRDFISFRKMADQLASKEMLLKQIPEVKLHNYAYRNNGDLTFRDVSEEWGLSIPTYSNGAAYVDLDNDGDMDLVVNNINDEALLFENKIRNRDKKNNHHFLQIKLIGDSLNRNGLGTWIEIFYDNKIQVYEQTPYRGYLSTVQLNPHFGLGVVAVIDSILIKWPNQQKQKLINIPVDQTVEVNITAATENFSWTNPQFASNTLFTEITGSLNIHYLHQEKDFIDFNFQKLLPHKLSEYGPALGVADVDGNGFDDIVAGGSVSNSPVILFQRNDGSFFQKLLLPDMQPTNKNWEEIGIVLFDVEGDGDPDLYTASGGYENHPNAVAYLDKLYINNGKGEFTLDSLALPKNVTSKSCVRTADYDKDGDLDLFIGGRVEPQNYPKAVSSYIYRNDSKKSSIKFTDVSSSVATSLSKVGLICDALWTDFNDDGWQDLMLAGEWMSIKFLKNNNGVLEDVTSSVGLESKTGLWNSLLPGDFDNDGDMDYIAGNTGENTFYKGSEQYPVSIYGKDFDNNGVLDCIPTKFIPDKEGVLREYTTHTRDDVVDQMPFIKKRFLTYKAFAEASIDKLFTQEQIKGAFKLQANFFKTAFLRNNGNGTFAMTALPPLAQVSCINGMIAEDFDGDGRLDVLAIGNDYGLEVSVGRYDAFNGLMLKGDGKGGFLPLSILQSGWFVPGNAKALVKLRSNMGKCLLVASQNRSNLKVFELKSIIKCIQLDPSDASAMIKYKNGIIQKREFSNGASFLSQSGRFLNLDENIIAVEIKDYKGNIRNVKAF
ncbi:MAG: VCBS repeat-containing protein [Chitinophagaceae bacterium]|nr:VCBS repeat-containing protein [Chitinophagaceae bacterium]